MNKSIHLLSANSKNFYGMEYFVSKAFKEFGYEVITTDYRVSDKYEVDTRIKYITDVDFLLAIKAERINPESIFSCRVPTILWQQDSIQANQEAEFVVRTKASLFDLVYTFNDFELSYYKQFNKNSYFLPLAADSDSHMKLNLDKNIAIGFIGNLNNNRIQMINYLLDKNIPIQYSYSKEDYCLIVNQTKINLNIGITGSGIQQRVFEILSMGGFLLTNKIDSINLFEDKKHLVYYENFDNLLELIYYYIDNDKERLQIAMQGREEVLRKHLYTHRVQQIIEDVKNVTGT